ncbi:glycosyltransferase [Gilvimarinus sp. SDUM040013]|uniref:Glycosyltransferase n=1 Tax=Gilvimarinus gilvus TaxID=3058038 RepID=A0ABU4RU88_9GAMM|nr:glycosyltransferase [Gilvimarinus sp. SDUM040013]MDO3386846.1 glycosyltransferase [Gilvimarinus sp. SDUM040013]MDX6848224.1 glycosyltransferase [Gilvimarinus sp. SDUM040013]
MIVVFWIAVAIPVAVILGNPLLLWLNVRFGKTSRVQSSTVDEGAERQRFAMVTVVKNPSQELLQQKLKNTQAIDGLQQWVLYHDGPAPDFIKQIADALPAVVSLHESGEAMGKNAVLNLALRECQGDIIIFSDMDSLLEPDCVARLQEHFKDPQVGGVCGQREIGEKGQDSSAQSLYINLDSLIKRWESQLGQITSNDGKLYAVRRSLTRHIPDGVTDDLYSGLSVIRSHRKMIFDQYLVARIRIPSRTLSHEIERRRRIVCRSLSGMWHHRALFNPVSFGFFAPRLFINKVLRRFIPHAVLLAVVAVVAINLSSPGKVAALVVAIALYLTVTLVGYYGLLRNRLPGLLKKLINTNAYVAAGLYGTFLGTCDFFLGRKYVMWVPKKN